VVTRLKSACALMFLASEQPTDLFRLQNKGSGEAAVETTSWQDAALQRDLEEETQSSALTLTVVLCPDHASHN